jgi:tetratricopeptide (TPR) repeat protein
MKLRILLTLYIIIGLPIALLAQRRQLQEARAIIKSGKNYDQAEKIMTKLLNDSANLHNPRIYDMWLLSVEKQYDQMNEAMYKKKTVDTTKFFNLTRRLFTIGERLDSLDMRPDKKGRVNLSYRSDNARRLATYRPNLYFGGAYHLRKDQLQTAYDCFEMYLDCDRQPLFTGYDFEKNDPRMATVAYWATYTGYRMGDPILTLRYAKEARRDTSKLEYTLQYVAQAWLKLKDSDSYVKTLQEGVALFPKSPYFFPRLMDYYMEKGNYEKGLSYAERALQTDSLNELFLLAKSTMLLNLGRYTDCLEASERLIKVNNKMADAYYNAGTACLNIALDMDSRQQKKLIRKMYQKAQPFMESYRQLMPDAKDKWGPSLYRIYFNLNLGRQFDEIDKILKK